MRAFEKAPVVWCAFLILDVIFMIGFFKADAVARRFFGADTATFGTSRLSLFAISYRLIVGFAMLVVTALLLFGR
jgi:hypothetical protein